MREQSQKIGGCGQPATPRGPPIDQHPPRSTPLTRPSQRREIDWIPPKPVYPPQTCLTYLEQCGRYATTNSRRTIGTHPGR